jgi:uncharacterized protein YjbI with pentapeptide repeats
MRDSDVDVPPSPQPVVWSDDQWEGAIDVVGRSGIFEAPSVEIDAVRIQQVLASAPRGDDDKALLKSVDCAGSRFTGDAVFSYLTFQGASDFSRASFAGGADFSMVSFGPSVNFTEAHFAADTSFESASFPGGALFDRTEFEGPLNFFGLTFLGEVWFVKASFGRADYFSLEGNKVVFNGATFSHYILVDVTGEEIDFSHAHFEQGCTIHVCEAEVILEYALFAGPSTLAGYSARTSSPPESSRALVQPRILSLRHAFASNLTLANLDLSSCLFAGAHHLHETAIEPDCTFAPTPARLRYTRRQTLAEEHMWRAEQASRAAKRRIQLPRWLQRGAWRKVDYFASERGGWLPPELQATWLIERGLPAETPSARRIAGIYRALRKGLEEGKNEPGAADFYYGEMEMRRKSATLLSAERVLLALYWALSGYALRASRALLALFIVVVVFAALLRSFGFANTHSYGQLLIYSVGTSARIETGPADQLTTAGEALHIALGIVGPLLYGLTLLSIRGRVKR